MSLETLTASTGIQAQEAQAQRAILIKKSNRTLINF